jgi:hypothetical protein
MGQKGENVREMAHQGHCARVISHLTKDKIPADKKAGFLTFMKNGRGAAKTSN